MASLLGMLNCVIIEGEEEEEEAVEEVEVWCSVEAVEWTAICVYSSTSQPLGMITIS